MGETLRKNRNKILISLLTFYAVIWTLLALNPYDRNDWLLENILIFLLLLFLLSTYRFFKFSITSYALFLIFLLLHTYGAHYSYTTTPIDQWIEKFIQLKRDHYDRIVHFSYGLLMVYPIRELVEKIVRVKKPWSSLYAVITVLASGAFYELIEMWVATIFIPELGVLFLGTQGDVWDTHHDMELAFFGSILTMGICSMTCFLKKKLFFPFDHSKK